jgi:hypothetical protein
MGENELIFDNITKSWAQARHELSIAEKGKLLAAVRLLANVSHEVFSRTPFGFFQDVRKEPFSSRYTGRFRVTHGKPPHSHFLLYSGTHSFSEAEAFVVAPEQSTALPLAPLIFGYPCAQHRDPDNGHCFLFDKLRVDSKGAEAMFKAANHSCSLTVSAASGQLAALVNQLISFRLHDPTLEINTDVKLLPDPHVRD